MVTELASACVTVAYRAGDFAPPPLRFDRSTYGGGRPALLRVDDAAADLDPGAVETMEVRLWSTADTAGIRVDLVETGPASSAFTGSVELDAESSSDPDDRLLAPGGAAVFARYTAAGGTRYRADALVSSRVIFTSGFETGDTSDWSHTQ